MIVLNLIMQYIIKIIKHKIRHNKSFNLKEIQKNEAQ